MSEGLTEYDARTAIEVLDVRIQHERISRKGAKAQFSCDVLKAAKV